MAKIPKEYRDKWWPSYYAKHRDELLAYQKNHREENREKIIGKQRERALLHREEKRAIDRRYYAKTKEKRLAYQKKYASENREKVLARHIDYYQRNKLRMLFLGKRRKARKKGNGGSHTLREWELLKERFWNKCLACGLAEPQIKLSQDHIIPLSLGGRDDIDNIQPLCLSCNKSKHDKIRNYIIEQTNGKNNKTN